MNDLATNDLVFSETHKRFVRFVRWADSAFAEVADRNTGRPLPDLVHRRQILTAADAARRTSAVRVAY